MVWHTRLNFAFRSFTSRVSRCESTIWRSRFSNSRSKGATFNGFSSFSLFSQRLGTRGVNRNFNNPFLSGSRRFYNVKLFKSTESKDSFVTSLLITSGIFLSVPLYFGYWEKVPYTKCTHWTMISIPMEWGIGETEFERTKVEFKGNILPPTHPESVRVRMIAKDIIGALQRGLGKENVLAEENEGKWHREDDKWVQKSWKKGQKQGKEPNCGTGRIFGWIVLGDLVVNDPRVEAVCLPGGKIVVFTGLLEYFTSDAEIATIIGHEVGHAVARHRAEGLINNCWFRMSRLILYHVGFFPDVIDVMSSLVLTWLPFSRRMEMEADYIGLLLIASAGYDPWVAPKVYERAELLAQARIMEKALGFYSVTHPFGKERAELLAQSKIMEEALTIYSLRS